jgi:hypothetical protein
VELRTYTLIEVLQPQVAAFLQTVARGFLPLSGQSALLVEIAPGLAIHAVTDAALKATQVIPGMLIVERAYGMVELHHFDQGQVRAAGEAVCRHVGVGEADRLRPRIVSEQTITGIRAHQGQLVNRMRHGQMIVEGRTLYVLEVEPAGYAAFAANEAEKASPIDVLEFSAFGAFGRVWLGGGEAEIAEAAAAIRRSLDAIRGRARS